MVIGISGRFMLAAMAVCVLGASGGQQPPAHPSADDGNASTVEPVDERFPEPVALDPAAESLMEDFDLSEADAAAQGALQVQVGRLERDMPPALRAGYAGRILVREGPGEVRLWATDPEALDELSAYFDAGGVPTSLGGFATGSQSELDDLAVELAAEVQNSRVGDLPAVEVGRSVPGMVSVRYVDGAMNVAEAEVVDRARSQPETFDVVAVASLTDGADSACQWFGDLECDKPLRGSVAIKRSSSASTFCTAGFNARSVSDGKPYVLTAGHCQEGFAGTWWTDFANGEPHAIGPMHSWEARPRWIRGSFG